MKITIHVYRGGEDLPDLLEKETKLFQAAWVAGQSLNFSVAEWVEVIRIWFPREAGYSKNPQVWKFEIEGVIRNPLNQKETATVTVFQQFYGQLNETVHEISVEITSGILNQLRSFARIAELEVKAAKQKIESFQ